MSKQIKQGNVTVEVADNIAPPPKAGKLTPAEVKSILKARTGVGLVCAASATAIDNLGAEFEAPRGLTAAALREAGKKAEDIDLVISNLELVINTLKQANLIFDAEAHALLIKLNDRVKETRKQNGNIGVAFGSLTEYFSNSSPKKPV